MWRLRLLLIALLGLLGFGGAAWGQTGCIPNPNDSAPPFIPGCPITALGLNNIFTSINSLATGAPQYNAALSTTESIAYPSAFAVNLTDTGTNTTGVAKIISGYFLEQFGRGATGPGNRNAVWGTVQQIGPTTYNGIDVFQSGLFGYVQVDVGNAPGQLLDYNGVTGLVTIDGGASSNANTVVAGEFDADVGTGSAVEFRDGLLIDSGGGNVPSVVRGSVFDAALSIAADNSAGTAGTWKNDIVFGNPNGEWPNASDSILMGAYGSGTMNAGIGIYLANVTFANFAMQLPGANYLQNGSIDVYGPADGSVTSIFAGPNAGVRISTSGTSAFVAATDKTGGGGYENLGLLGAQVILEPQGAGGFAQVQGKFNLSTVTGAGAEVQCLYLDASGNVGAKPSGGC